MCISGFQECTINSQITHSAGVLSELSYHFHLCRISACWSRWTPCGVLSSFIFRTISQPSVSHLNGVSHRNDWAFFFSPVYSNAFPKKRQLLKIWLSFPKGDKMMIKWNVSSLYNHQLSLPVSVFRLLSLTDGLSPSPFAPSVQVPTKAQSRKSALLRRGCQH